MPTQFSPRAKRVVIATTALAILLALGLAAWLPSQASAPGDWSSHSRDAAGSHHSPLTQITPANVAQLTLAWSLDLATLNDTGSTRLLPSNYTPLAIDGIVYLPTPYGKLLAVDGATGRQVWAYSLDEEDAFVGRGIGYWKGDRDHAPRLFAGTRSGKVIAIDVRTGQPVAGFTAINLQTEDVMNGLPTSRNVLNSAPILYDDVLITGSRVQESPALGAYGDVRGWDARTGKLLWTFHSIPRPGEPGNDTWDGDSWRKRSGVNVWTLMSVDTERGIAYLPFGAPAYDRIGIDRKGANLYANSLVAVDARTGKYLWHYQHVHHDIWDLDSLTEPTLVDVRRDGRTIPAVVAMSKKGLLFILDRVTGKPLFEVKEVPVPPSSIPGEVAWPTQPMPVAPPPLVRQSMTYDEISDITPEHQAFCQARVRDEKAGFARPWEPIRADRPMIRFPGQIGGPGWGGGAFDPESGLYIINTSEMGGMEQMGMSPSGDWGNITGRPSSFQDPATRMPCHKGSWGDISAIDVSKGTIVWRTRLGITETLPLAKQKTGRRNHGGPIVTAGGLVFIGATDDSRFRAFDARTGRELWTYKLPASAMATAITYLGKDGRQYVAVTAAGGSALGAPVTASTLLVFALPKRGGESPKKAQVPPPSPRKAAATPPQATGELSRPDVAAIGYGDFPAGPGRDLVVKACTGCHAPAQVTGQRLSRDEWRAMVIKMIGYGADVPEDKEAAIVDYLAKNFPAAR